MAASIWAPGTDYPLGAMVLARSAPTVIQQDLTNPGFESGASGWTLGANWSISSGSAFAGTWKASRTNTAGTSIISNNNEVPVVAGQTLRAWAALKASSTATARVGIEWRDAAHALLLREYADEAVTDTIGWKHNEVEKVAPALAAYAVMIVEGVATGGLLELIAVDACGWNYAYVDLPPSLLFEATTAGVSASVEPTWPTSIAATVADGTVVWTARAASRVVWKAVPIMKSGLVEPTWPLVPGQLVNDNGISWETVTRRIEDALCPNSKQVTITASKVWAGDGDIVRFCAVNNAKDWQAPNDAGYLPTGLHMQANNQCTALDVYRGNLVPMSDSTFQMWGVDEDPAANAILDTMEGIGTVHNLAMEPVGPELFLLTARGVRSVGIIAQSQNMSTVDVGSPVDSLILESVATTVAANGMPFGMYFPGAGQYWLVSGNDVFVYTLGRPGSIGAWSRYTFPFGIRGRAQLGDSMYLLCDDGYVREITDTVNYDEVAVGEEPTFEPEYFDGLVQWPWLDFGAPGRDKVMEGFEIVGEGEPTVSFGYDQRSPAAFTPDYAVAADTLSDGMIAMPLTAPTMAVRVKYIGAEDNFWQLYAVNVGFLNA
jgi:hypothetical protein